MARTLRIVSVLGVLVLAWWLIGGRAEEWLPPPPEQVALDSELLALSSELDEIDAELPMEKLTRVSAAIQEGVARSAPQDVDGESAWARIRRFGPNQTLRILSIDPLQLTPEELARSAALNPRDTPLSPQQLEAVSTIIALVRPTLTASKRLLARVQTGEVEEVIRRGETRPTGMDALPDEASRAQARHFAERRVAALEKQYRRLGQAVDSEALLQRAMNDAAEHILKGADQWGSHTVYAAGYEAAPIAITTAQLPLTRETHRTCSYYREVTAEFLIQWFSANGFLTPDERTARSHAYRALRDEAAKLIGFH